MKKEHPVAIVRRCLRNLHIGSSCTACVDACPVGAFEIAGKRLRFISARCTGCGACGSACPQDAVLFPSLEDGGLEERVRSLAASGRVVFASRLVRKIPPEAIVIPSVAWLDLGWILFVAAEGAYELELISAAESTEAKLVTLVRSHVHSARKILSELGSAMEIRWLRAASKVDLGRRAWFSGILEPAGNPGREEPSSEAADALAARLSNEPLRQVPQSRRLLVYALRRLRERLAEKNRDGHLPESQSAASLMVLPVLDRLKCSSCGICSAICPTGALSMGKTDSEAAIWLRPEACTACRLCSDICFMKAVSLVPRAAVGDSITGNPEKVLAMKNAGKGLDTWEDKLAGMISAPIYRT